MYPHLTQITKLIYIFFLISNLNMLLNGGNVKIDTYGEHTKYKTVTAMNIVEFSKREGCP